MDQQHRERTSDDTAVHSVGAPGRRLIPVESGVYERFTGYTSALRELNRDDFLSQHGYPCLIQISSPSSDDAGFDTATNLTSKIATESAISESIVIPIIKQSDNHFEQMITVGRASNNDIQLRHNQVSKFHAYFSFNGQDWILKDSKSTNGTFVNDVRITDDPWIILGSPSIRFSWDLRFQFFTPEALHKAITALQ